MIKVIRISLLWFFISISLLTDVAADQSGLSNLNVELIKTPYDISSLDEDAAGHIYGTTFTNDDNGGTVFELRPDGGLDTIYSFNEMVRKIPAGTFSILQEPTLISGNQGNNIFGFTLEGSPSNVDNLDFGEIFSIKDNRYQTIFNTYPFHISHMIAEPNGMWYGSATDLNRHGFIFTINLNATRNKITPINSTITENVDELPEIISVGTTGDINYSVQHGDILTKASLEIIHVSKEGIITKVAELPVADRNISPKLLLTDYGSFVQDNDGVFYAVAESMQEETTEVAIIQFSHGKSTKKLITITLKGRHSAILDKDMIMCNFMGNIYLLSKHTNELAVLKNDKFLLVHHFSSGNDGAYPESLFNTNNEILGITSAGGENGSGTIFSVVNGKFETVASLPASLNRSYLLNIKGVFNGSLYVVASSIRDHTWFLLKAPLNIINRG